MGHCPALGSGPVTDAHQRDAEVRWDHGAEARDERQGRPGHERGSG